MVETRRPDESALSARTISPFVYRPYTGRVRIKCIPLYCPLTMKTEEGHLQESKSGVYPNKICKLSELKLCLTLLY